MWCFDSNKDAGREVDVQQAKVSGSKLNLNGKFLISQMSKGLPLKNVWLKIGKSTRGLKGLKRLKGLGSPGLQAN